MCGRLLVTEIQGLRLSNFLMILSDCFLGQNAITLQWGRY